MIRPVAPQLSEFNWIMAAEAAAEGGGGGGGVNIFSCRKGYACVRACVCVCEHVSPPNLNPTRPSAFFEYTYNAALQICSRLFKCGIGGGVGGLFALDRGSETRTESLSNTNVI